MIILSSGAQVLLELISVRVHNWISVILVDQKKWISVLISVA